LGVPYSREIHNIGTGVLFTADGYIITNAHVVENAQQIKVVLNNNEEYEAQLMGMDSLHDIAVIRIDARFLSPAHLGTSSDLMIGEWVIAIGNPYGFLMKDSKPSVSVGVVSAIDRSFVDTDNGKVYKSMIQTDAAINPGNSGGPLVNIYGEVIGINSFIFSESGGSVGIGFAIPIDRVKRITEELIAFGRIREVYFGFKIQEITPLIANHLRLRSLDGVIVSAVDSNGPAYAAGLKRGDIITVINNDTIRNSADAELAVSDSTPGSELNIKFLREGKEFEIYVIAGEYQ
jgi:serine protease Do